jgi:hypothetical protein
MALLLTATVAVGSVLSTTRVLAVGPDEGAGAATDAKRHYEEGTKAFNLGEFARAISEFKATYNAKPDPLLLYNIAQSYRLAGDASQALFFYKSFLRNMPGATNRKEVEAQVRKLEKQLQQQGDEQKREPVTPASVNPPPASAVPAGPTPPAPATVTPPPAPTTIRSSNPVAESQHEPVSAPAIAPAIAASPPVPPTPAQQPEMNLTVPAPVQVQSARPIYEKWWFWAGAAGAVVIVGGIAAANAKKGPSTTWGTYEPQF